MFAHDFPGPLAIIEKAWISDLAFELPETFEFAFDEEIEVHDVAAIE